MNTIQFINDHVPFSEETSLIAAASSSKKTPEEIKAVKIMNMEKARAYKALYKKMDEEAKARGEVPPSVARKLEREFPVMLDENKQVRRLDLNAQLWDTKVTVALPQLLYYAPELHYQYLNLLGGQPSSHKRKVPSIISDTENMDIDRDRSNAVNKVSMDTTTQDLSQVLLQSVKVNVNDKIDIDFLIDGGAVASIIPLHLVKTLGKLTDIHPTNKTLKYAGGDVDILRGIIKLNLKFDNEVDIVHTFCVTENPSTPLILGMDFLLGTNSLADPHKQILTFFHEDGDVEVPTRANANITFDLEDPEALVIPVSITRNKNNKQVQDITIEYECDFTPGDVQLLWLKLDDTTIPWTEDMIIQPAVTLFSKLGLYLVPSVLKKDNEGKPHGVIIVNMTQKNVILNKETLLGQLFTRSSVPKGVEFVTSMDKIMDRVTELYIDFHDKEETITAPSFIEGPIFEPTIEEFKAAGIAFVASYTDNQVKMVNNVTVGQDKDQSDTSSSNGKEMEWDINPELTKDQRARLIQVLIKYKSVFATSLKEIKSLKVEKYSIKVKPGTRPVKVAPRMLPIAATEWLKSYITQLIGFDLVEEGSGAWAAAVVLVPNDKENRQPRRRFKKMIKIPRLKTGINDKKPQAIWSVSLKEQTEEIGEKDVELSSLETLRYSENTSSGHIVEIKVPTPVAGNKDPYRLCLNYRPINLAVMDTGYPIPNINALFTLLANATFYSVFDCLKGFWQLELDEESRDYTGFTTTFGQYRWKRLPMGLKVSPQAWQSCMDGIFFEELNQFFLIYIDDGLVFSQSFDEHLIHLDKILGKASKANLSLSVSKCKFGYQEVKLLGHIVGKNGFKMDPAKVERINNWPRPTCVTEINQFIGMIQYYRRYLRGLSEIIAPMNYLKKKNVPFNWTIEQENSFQKCKNLLTDDQVLIHPDFSKPFLLFTDASNFGIGGVLSQAEGDDGSFVRPVYYGSKALTDAEKRTSIYEKEFLAIVYFIHFFKMYLIGHKFTVYTDQKSLQYLIKFNEEASAKVVRWQASLLAYDFDIVYRAGKLNANADALSRLKESYSRGPELEEIIEDYYLPLNAAKHGRDEEEELDDKRKKKMLDDENIYSNSDGMSDEEYMTLIWYLTRCTFPVNSSTSTRISIKNKSMMYEVINGELYRKANGTFNRRRVLRCKEVLQVLLEKHDHLMAGHQGVRRTFDKIKSDYYWSGYYDTIRRYVSSCEICQSFGPRNPPVPLSLNPKMFQESPFSHVMIDYINLPSTTSGNNAALVMVDKFTGWVECKPTPTQSSFCTCIALFEWICQYGIMLQVQCDNGLHFNAEEVKVLMMSSYGIQLRFGVPYHPQGQGKVERTNGTIKSILKKYAMRYGDDWDSWLPAVLYVLRTTAKNDHGYSAFFLAYGRQPRNVIEQIDEEVMTFEELDQNEENLFNRIAEIVELNLKMIPKAKSNMAKYKEKMISQYNKKSKKVTYRVDDLVMVLDRQASEMSTSLLPKWYGPFRIKEIVGQDIYIIKDGDMKLPYAFHASQLKMYKTRPRLASSLDFYSKVKPLE